LEVVAVSPQGTNFSIPSGFGESNDYRFFMDIETDEKRGLNIVGEGWAVVFHTLLVDTLCGSATLGS
jgi:hypothetical protein